MDVLNDRRRQFEQLAEEVFEPLQRYLLRRAPTQDVDDLLSETLLVMWRRLDAVPSSAPLPWCYGVARRTLANHRRSAARRLRLAERIAREAAVSSETQTEDVEDLELSAALATLSLEDRELLRLWAWEHLEPREIAQVLESTPNAVSLRLRRARQKLADEILRQKAVGPGQIPDKNAQEM